MCKNTYSNWINDKLRNILAKTCNKKIEEINKSYLKTLNELDLSDNNINSLKGIEYAINLTSINLNKNDIVDASYLGKLTNLKKLELSENRVEDISFITNLKNLESVGLDSNNIYVIPDLSKLKKLILINICDNKISDLSFIDNLYNEKVKVIANEQLILLANEEIEFGDNYFLETPIKWSENTKVLLDNIQVSGSYEDVKTNKRPSLLYSISEVLIKNIYSDCLIKAEFYHEVPFFKSGTLSGFLIKPLSIKSKK